MKFLIVMVIIKFALVLFFLKDYPIANLDDIKNSAKQVLDLSVESLNEFISHSKKSDITMPLSIDEIDLLLDAPIDLSPKLPSAEERLESLIDEQANSSPYLQNQPIRNNKVSDPAPPLVPNFEKKSWAELFQEINKMPTR